MLRYDRTGKLVGLTIVDTRRLVGERRDVPITLHADQLAPLVG